MIQSLTPIETNFDLSRIIESLSIHHTQVTSRNEGHVRNEQTATILTISSPIPSSSKGTRQLFQLSALHFSSHFRMCSGNITQAHRPILTHDKCLIVIARLLNMNFLRPMIARRCHNEEYISNEFFTNHVNDTSTKTVSQWT